MQFHVKMRIFCGGLPRCARNDEINKTMIKQKTKMKLILTIALWWLIPIVTGVILAIPFFIALDSIREQNILALMVVIISVIIAVSLWLSISATIKSIIRYRVVLHGTEGVGNFAVAKRRRRGITIIFTFEDKQGKIRQARYFSDRLFYHKTVVKRTFPIKYIGRHAVIMLDEKALIKCLPNFDKNLTANENLINFNSEFYVNEIESKMRDKDTEAEMLETLDSYKDEIDKLDTDIYVELRAKINDILEERSS